MNAYEREYELDDVAKTVIGAAYAVSNALGCGFLEKVYQRAMACEMVQRGLIVKPNASFSIYYRGQNIGEYVADLVVDDRIIVELKCVDTFVAEHMAQCLNYLKASDMKLALLINFQKPRVEWKRVVRNK